MSNNDYVCDDDDNECYNSPPKKKMQIVLEKKLCNLEKSASSVCDNTNTSNHTNISINSEC